MRKGILDIQVYADSEEELMLGFLSALASSAIWLLAATFLKLPISGTHSIVGSTIGFSLVARGTQGVQWGTLGEFSVLPKFTGCTLNGQLMDVRFSFSGTIISSWFVSPVLSGIMSAALYWGIRAGILNAKKPLNAGLIALPVFYGLTVCVNVLSIVHDGPKCEQTKYGYLSMDLNIHFPPPKSFSQFSFLVLYMDNIAAWVAITLSVIIGLIVAIGVQLFVVPWQRRKITNARNGGPVTFIINDSNESTPSGSPRKNRRPIADGKSLPAITEQTELSSFNNLSGVNPGLYANQKYGNAADTKLVANGFGVTHSTNYKIDPKIIQKAENLLGKSSLDNTDLTITSLNFIDEHHQPNGNVPFERNGKALQAHFDPKHGPSNSRYVLADC